MYPIVHPDRPLVKLSRRDPDRLFCMLQLLGMGCHVDDRDALTDMTLLHYAVKAGSSGVGDPPTALQVSPHSLTPEFTPFSLEFHSEISLHFFFT